MKNLENLQSLNESYAKNEYKVLDKNSTAIIKGDRNDLPPNWRMYIARCSIGSKKENSSIEVKINNENTNTFNNISTDDNKYYYVDGAGPVRNIEITIRNIGSRNFYIDAIYFEVMD